MSEPNLSLVNIVSEVPGEVWRRELDPSLRVRFHYSSKPQPADWHVVYGLTTDLAIPNVRGRTIFVTPEPPAVVHYDRRVLRRYGLVVTGGFRYLARMPNTLVRTGLLPWRLGVAYEVGNVQPALSRADILEARLPTEDRVTVVTSLKSQTPHQRDRLRLLDFLARRIPELEVYGRDRAAIADKATALRKGRYHLALENCAERFFWTEKLADPLLLRNFTFYSGSPDIAADFNMRSIRQIDVNDHEASYATIRRSLDNDDFSKSGDALSENRDSVLNRANLQAVLESIVVNKNDARVGMSHSPLTWSTGEHRSSGPLRRLIQPGL